MLTPHIHPPGESPHLLPVLVFLHGGAYSRGASSNHGPERLMEEGIVLVTVNYRLGVLGEITVIDRGCWDALSRTEGGSPSTTGLGRWVRFQHPESGFYMSSIGGAEKRWIGQSGGWYSWWYVRVKTVVCSAVTNKSLFRCIFLYDRVFAYLYYHHFISGNLQFSLILHRIIET